MLYEARLARARQAMREKGIDLLLLTPATDLFYLTGMRGHLFERLACCIITKDEVHFISPVFELGNLKEDTRSLLTATAGVTERTPLRWRMACCRGRAAPLLWAQPCPAGCCLACRRCGRSTLGFRPKA